MFNVPVATKVRDVFGAHGIRYLFMGKSGAILLGFSDATQDIDVFVDKTKPNQHALIAALKELGFDVSESLREEILRGKDFIQLRQGPFELDILFAPDGIENFQDAWSRRVESHGFPVCAIEDIIGSKRAANRVKDKESLGRLQSFADWLKTQK